MAIIRSHSWQDFNYLQRQLNNFIDIDEDAMFERDVQA